MSRASPALVALLVALCLAAAVCVEGRRPGPRASRRIRPSPEDLRPFPEDLNHIPPPERSAVDPAPGISAADVQEGDVQPDQTAAACGSYTETNIRPFRQQWDSGNGYCGEMSLQMTAMTRGIYISQKTSRSLGVAAGANHPDLLFDERVQPTNAMSGIFGVAKMIGLDQAPESYWYSDNMTVAVTQNVQGYTLGTVSPSTSSFALWMKKNVIAGRPVIGGYRVRSGGYPDYDHIMPVFGMCYSSTTSLATSDMFVLTDDYMKELKRSPADSTFYAKYQKCTYSCIPNDYYAYGVAVGPLKVPAGVYFPVKITITGWSDGSAVNMEPGEYATTIATTASYSLAVSGLTAGQTYRLYRTTGLFAGFTIPQSASVLAATCASQGTNCCSIPFIATGASAVFNQTSTGTGTTQLGQFPARGVSYFLVVKA